MKKEDCDINKCRKCDNMHQSAIRDRVYSSHLWLWAFEIIANLRAELLYGNFGFLDIFYIYIVNVLLYLVELKRVN